MRRRSARTAAAFLVFLLVFVPAAANAVDRGDELQSQLDQSQGRLSETESQLNSNKAQQGDLVARMLELDKSISELNGQLAGLAEELNGKVAERARTEEELVALKAELEKTLKELEAAKVRLAAQVKVLNARVRGIYVNGTATYAAVLVNSSSFADFVNRLSFLSFLANSDAKLVKKITGTKAEIERKEKDQRVQAAAIETKRLALIDDERRISEIRVGQEDRKASLQGEQESRRALVGELQRSEGALQVAAEEEEATSDRVAANIGVWREQVAFEARVQADARARAEAEARAAAEAAAAAGGGEERASEPAPSEPAPAYEPPPPVYAPSWVWPTGSMYDITSYFGWRTAPTSGASSFHQGIDIGVDYGTPIVAAHSGLVIQASYYGGFGNFVLIDRGDGISSSYAHMDSFAVYEGEYVEAGQLIGYVGSTGVSTGAHLDFRIYVDGVAENPLNWF